MPRFYASCEGDLYLFNTGGECIDLNLLSETGLFGTERDWMLSPLMVICRGVDDGEWIILRGILEGAGYREAEVERSVLESGFRRGALPSPTLTASFRRTL
ncbi:MAG: hypothetical protein ACLFVP_04245 [Candidatus Bathyarchaeia archaeon]